eukprot:gene2910-2123_t
MDVDQPLNTVPAESNYENNSIPLGMFPPTVSSKDARPEVSETYSSIKSEEKQKQKKLTRKSKYGMYEDIEEMMFGFGDDWPPAADTVELVEDLAVKYIKDLCQRAVQVAGYTGKLDKQCFMLVLQILRAWQSAKKVASQAVGVVVEDEEVVDPKLDAVRAVAEDVGAEEAIWEKCRTRLNLRETGQAVVALAEGEVAVAEVAALRKAKAVEAEGVVGAAGLQQTLLHPRIHPSSKRMQVFRTICSLYSYAPDPESASGAYDAFCDILGGSLTPIDDLRLVLHETVPPAEFGAEDLIGCRVDVWNSVDGQRHTGRILAQRSTPAGHVERLVHFQRGLDGRNASIGAWLALQEHVAVVYRDVFFLRHGHSGLWQPVQCALRSGLFILRQKISSQAAASQQPPSSASMAQPASASDSTVAFDAVGAHDLCVYSFQLDDLVLLREVLPQNCRPFVGVDFFALRMTKATLVACLDARVEAEERLSVSQAAARTPLDALQRDGLRRCGVDLAQLAAVAAEYAQWRGLTLPFVAGPRRTLDSGGEDAQRDSYAADVDVFRRVEALLARRRVARPPEAVPGDETANAATGDDAVGSDDEAAGSSVEDAPSALDAVCPLRGDAASFVWQRFETAAERAAQRYEAFAAIEAAARAAAERERQRQLSDERAQKLRERRAAAAATRLEKQRRRREAVEKRQRTLQLRRSLAQQADDWTPPAEATLATLPRGEWLDRVVRDAQRGARGRVVGCDAGDALVRLEDGTLLQTKPSQLQLVAPVATRGATTDAGDELLRGEAGDLRDDFLPADFSVAFGAAPAPPPAARRKKPEPERRVRVLDFTAMLQNEDRVAPAAAKKLTRQPLLQAIKRDQIERQGAPPPQPLPPSLLPPRPLQAPPQQRVPAPLSLAARDITKYGRGAGAAPPAAPPTATAPPPF